MFVEWSALSLANANPEAKVLFGFAQKVIFAALPHPLR
jgi:hypothetical protein